uniref:AP-2 complex subunit alpha n=2 Tax=Auxenochlorella protothecoides TaxID=3075 RepID=A0A1D2AG34_AUXPR
MAKVTNVRGLRNYIQELRNCSSKEQEKERVDKELGKVRKKYTSDKAMSAYDKRKYMWKLLYTHMLGYNVEFGHKQAMDLIAAPGYAEKQVGYVACAVFLSEQDEFLRLVINSVRNDLISRNEAFQCLALDFTANVGGAEFAQLLTVDVMGVLANGATRPVVRKKAALCLLRLIRKAPLDAEVLSPGVWGSRLAGMLADPDVGVLLGLTTLLLGVAARSYVGYEACVPRLIAVLDRCKAREVPQDYTYYGLASPWLQVKALRVLQYFPPPEDPAVRGALVDTLKRILGGSEPVKNANKNNAVHAIVFEAVALAIGLEDADLLTAGAALLARFLAVREPNLRYLALESLARLAGVPAVAETLARHARTVRDCLADPDVSIARRAMDLLFTMASPATAAGVVETLLAFLPTADYSLREELVLKTAVLAERFLPNLEWYVDSMLTLMEQAGEFAINDLWQSVVHLVTNSPELHAYAAGRVLEALRRGQPPETFLKVAAHVLGEFGPLLPDTTPGAEYAALAAHFPAAGPETKAIMLTAFSKLALAAPEDGDLQAAVRALLERHARGVDAELQQRAVEYTGLLAGGPALAKAAVQPLPRWEGRGSLLLRRLEAYEGEEGNDEGLERPGWLQGEAAAGAPAAAGDGPASAPGTPGVGAVRPPGDGAGPAPLAVPDLLDLLDLGEPSSTTPAPGGLEGLGLPPTPQQATPAPSPPHPAPAAVAPSGSLEAWSRRLWTQASGILYEDANLQAGVKSAFSGAAGTVTVFLGNKTGGALAGVALEIVGAPPHLTATLPAPPPAMLEPRRQVQVPLEVGAGAPGSAPLRLRLAYHTADGAAADVQLDLPLPPAKFSQPVDVPTEVFAARWEQVAGPPFKLSADVAPASGALSDAAVQQLLASLHLRVLAGVAGVPPGATAAACVLHVGGGAAPARQIPCMVVVAAGAGRVTVATADGAASAALLSQLTSVLGWGA